MDLNRRKLLSISSIGLTSSMAGCISSERTNKSYIIETESDYITSISAYQNSGFIITTNVNYEININTDKTDEIEDTFIFVLFDNETDKRLSSTQLYTGDKSVYHNTGNDFLNNIEITVIKNGELERGIGYTEVKGGKVVERVLAVKE